jgi:hypothetical protein
MRTVETGASCPPEAQVQRGAPGVVRVLADRTTGKSGGLTTADCKELATAFFAKENE